MWVWCELVQIGDQPLLSALPEVQVSAAGPWSLGLDDGTGVRVARSSFHGDLKFSWDLFAGVQVVPGPDLLDRLDNSETACG